jgi:hypothetical protein
MSVLLPPSHINDLKQNRALHFRSTRKASADMLNIIFGSNLNPVTTLAR